MNEYEVTDLQIKQGWIQMKGVYFLYQLQVVVNNDDVEAALTRLQNWSTQLAVTVIPII